MPAEAIRLSLINQALVQVGEATVSSLTDDDDTLLACNICFDQIIDEELETGVWKFAQTTTAPTHLTDEAEEPLTEQWQLPADCLKVIAVLYNGQVLMGEFYEINGTVLRTIYDSLITVTYLLLPTNEIWPARFKGIVIGRLRAIAHRALEQQADADRADEKTEIKTIKAKHAEASQRPNRPTNDGSIVQRRRNQVGRR